MKYILQRLTCAQLLGAVWLAVVCTVAMWSFLLWGMQWAWSRFTEGTSLRLDTAFLYTWGSLVAVNPPIPQSSIFGQVLDENKLNMENICSPDAAHIMMKYVVAL